MRRFDTQEEYEQFVQEIADAERELVVDVPDEKRVDHDDGYQGGEDEYTIAQMVITAPRRIDGEETMLFNGQPYVDTRVVPTDVFLYSERTGEVPDAVIENNDIRRAAVIALATDLREELTPDDN